MSHRIATASATRAAALVRSRASASSSIAANLPSASAISACHVTSSPSASSPLSINARGYSTSGSCTALRLSPCSSRVLSLPGRIRWRTSPEHGITSRRDISSTPHLFNGSSSKTDEIPVKKDEGGEEESECPPWQNPLHHNNPDYDGAKIFAEDFEPGEEMPVVPLPPFEPEGDGKVIAPPHVHELAEEIVHMNMIEVAELVQRVGDHFGFDDNDAFGDEGGEEGGAAEEVVEEKTVFDLKLTGFDAKSKIKVIKEIRSITTLGLKEAKELVEGAPTVVKKDIKTEEAEELKAKLEAVGATIEIV